MTSLVYAIPGPRASSQAALTGRAEIVGDGIRPDSSIERLDCGRHDSAGSERGEEEDLG